MNVLPRLSGPARWAALPRRTVRLRLTALYGGLFLASGAGLLTITNILARSWPWPALVVSPDSGGSGRIQAAPSPIPAQVRAQAAAQHAAALTQLLAESAIALGIMAVVSVALGWLMAGRVLRPLREMTAAARAISADDLSKRLAVPGPDDELKDLMTANLIDNAVRHNHPGGWIRAHTSRDGPIVQLLVENGGPVLDQDKVTTLAQPFRRLGGDRTGSATGTGLGLSIADAIAAAHGGTLHLHARPEGGLRAVIDLPAVGSTGPPAQLAVAGGAR